MSRPPAISATSHEEEFGARSIAASRNKRTRFSFRLAGQSRLKPGEPRRGGHRQGSCSRRSHLSARRLLSSTREIKIRSLPLTGVGTTARCPRYFQPDLNVPASRASAQCPPKIDGINRSLCVIVNVLPLPEIRENCHVLPPESLARNTSLCHIRVKRRKFKCNR